MRDKEKEVARLNKRIETLEIEEEKKVDIKAARIELEKEIENLGSMRAIVVCSDSTLDFLEENFRDVYKPSMKQGRPDIKDFDIIIYKWDNVGHTESLYGDIARESGKPIVYIEGTNRGLILSKIFRELYK